MGAMTTTTDHVGGAAGAGDAVADALGAVGSALDAGEDVQADVEDAAVDAETMMRTKSARKVVQTYRARWLQDSLVNEGNQERVKGLRRS